MSRPSRIASHLLRPTLASALCLTLLCLMGAGRGSIVKLTLDSDARVVDLFDGQEQGQFEIRVVAMNPHEGKVFITNQTDKPLTVAVPKAVVGVHVLPQVGNNSGNGFFGSSGNANQTTNGASGQGQSVGGNLSPVGSNGSFFPNSTAGKNNSPPGNGFFSIPPDKTVQLGLSSVCLNHGRPNPNSGMKYRLVRVESHTSDTVLQQLLEDYSPRTNKDARQAAAWHLANGFSWKQLANLTEQPIPSVAVPLFTKSQISAARELVEQARRNADQRPAQKVAPSTPAVAAVKR